MLLNDVIAEAIKKLKDSKEPKIQAEMARRETEIIAPAIAEMTKTKNEEIKVLNDNLAKAIEQKNKEIEELRTKVKEAIALREKTHSNQIDVLRAQQKADVEATAVSEENEAIAELENLLKRINKQ